MTHRTPSTPVLLDFSTPGDNGDYSFHFEPLFSVHPAKSDLSFSSRPSGCSFPVSLWSLRLPGSRGLGFRGPVLPSPGFTHDILAASSYVCVSLAQPKTRVASCPRRDSARLFPKHLGGHVYPQLSFCSSAEPAPPANLPHVRSSAARGNVCVLRTQASWSPPFPRLLHQVLPVLPPN